MKSGSVSQIIHKIVVNTESNTCIIKPPIDIHQGDTNTHVLFFQLRNNYKEFISIDSDYHAKIEFYKSYDNSLISSDDVVIDNYYRGQLSYVVSNALVSNYGRYTTYLKLYDSSDSEIYSISFIVVVSKNHSYSPKSNEVVMTKDFYDTLNAHMDNQEIHVGTEDRDFLDTFNDKIEDLNDLLAIGLHVDSELSTESTNPVENKVITDELGTKENLANKVQEILYEIDEDVAKSQYPSIYSVLQDKLLSIDVENIAPADLPKNVTLNALLEYDNKSRVSNPNIWELSAGWYLSRGTINIAPETPLDRLTIDDRIILVSSAVVAAPFYVYVAIIMPTEISGQGSGASIVYCFYDKTSSDPEDFSYQVENILTSGIMETDISETDNRIPTSLAVVNYVANKLSVTEVASPNLWELDTGLYLCSGDISVTEETVIPIGDAKIYAFINRIGEAGEESNLFTLFNMPFGIMYGYSNDSSHGQIHGTVDDSQISTSFDEHTSDNDHVPTTKAVVDYFEDNLEIKSVVGTVENPIHTWELDDGLYWLSGEIFVNLRVSYTGVSKPMLAYKRGLFIWIPSQNVWYSMRHYDTDNAVTGFVESTRVLREMPANPSAQSGNILTDYAVKNYVDNLISAINGGSY